MHRRSFLRGMLASAVAVPAASKMQRPSVSKSADPLADQASIYRDNFGVPHILVLLRYVKVDGFVCELRCHNTRTLRSR
jgi:hypothetical protein